MSEIRAGRGNNLAEQLAIEAKLELLNLSVDPTSRRIRGADASDVQDGNVGLVKAAQHTGAPDIIDLGDFSALATKWKGFSADKVAKLWGGDDATVRQAQMISAAHTLQGIGAKIDSLEAQGYPIDRHKALAELFTKLAADLSAALAKPALAFASEKELSAMKEAFAIYREALEPRAADMQYGLAFNVADNAFSYAGSEDPRYQKVIATGHEIRKAYLSIEQLSKLFDPHLS